MCRGDRRRPGGNRRPCRSKNSQHDDRDGCDPCDGKKLHEKGQKHCRCSILTIPFIQTIRQAARFQTFPDWYVFEGGLMSSGEQIGNAVPPEMARRLLESITARALSAHTMSGRR
jgi:site-specific DNA-cytosine methylase